MPPKKEPKKTRKQLRLEEIAKRKEDERIREEEEKKKQEEDEARRIEMERLQKIEDENFAREEAQRLADEEKTEVEDWNKNLYQHAQLSAKKNLELEDWKKFMECKQTPDATKESDLTTFITQHKEDKKIKMLQVEEILDQCQQAENLVTDLLKIKCKALSERRYDKAAWCDEYAKQIRDITDMKFLDITSHLAINSDILLEQKQQDLLKKQQQEGAMKQQYKADEKQKYDILKAYAKYKDFRYGIFINSNARQGGQTHRYKPIDYLDAQIQCEIPKPYLQNNLIMKAHWVAYDNLTPTQNYTKDIVMGGVLDVECYEFLPLPKKSSNWTLKYDYEVQQSLKKLHFPTIDQTGKINYATASPVKVIYTLPPYLFIHPNDKHKIALYDKQQGWITENIEDLKFDNEKKQLTFTTTRLAPLAYLQERCTDFPYVSFKLRCVNQEKALLDIIGKRQSFKFEIGGGFVKLLARNDPELAHLVNEQMEPSTLLHEMQRCGINLIPVEEDAQSANITHKNIDAEAHAILNVAVAVNAFFIKSSRWSQRMTADKILLRFRENPEYDEEFHEDQEKDWKSIVFWRNKVGLIQAKDSAEQLNEKLITDTLTHSTLEILLKKHELIDSDTLDKIRDVHLIDFMETLKKMLTLLRLFAFINE